VDRTASVAAASPADSGSAASADPNDTAAADDLGHRLVESAQTFLGVPYQYGGESRNGIDCSAFVRAVYSQNGIDLPRVSGDQASVGYDVPHDVASGDWARWAPGDRLYFACHHSRIDHTGMYIGGGLFIHASVGHDNQVAIDRVDNPYYAKHLVAVRRSAELLHEDPDPGDSVVVVDSGASSAPAAQPGSTSDPIINTDTEASQE
jgi:cell wall-associated NlpC family hydrolase